MASAAASYRRRSLIAAAVAARSARGALIENNRSSLASASISHQLGIMHRSASSCAALSWRRSSQRRAQHQLGWRRRQHRGGWRGTRRRRRAMWRINGVAASALK